MLISPFSTLLAWLTFPWIFEFCLCCLVIALFALVWTNSRFPPAPELADPGSPWWLLNPRSGWGSASLAEEQAPAGWGYHCGFRRSRRRRRRIEDRSGGFARRRLSSPACIASLPPALRRNPSHPASAHGPICALAFLDSRVSRSYKWAMKRWDDQGLDKDHLGYWLKILELD